MVRYAILTNENIFVEVFTGKDSTIPPPQGIKYYIWDEPTLNWILQDNPFYTPPT